VLWHGTEPGDPWAEQPDPALLRIHVDEVLTAIDSLHQTQEMTSA
jgi:hypothetical protein